MTATDRAAEVVCELTFRPLPPAELSKNRTPGHWSGVRRAYRALKDDAGWQIREQCGSRRREYPALVQTTIWRQCGVVADPDAIVARTAPARDAAEALGLIANDALIEIGPIERVRVLHKHEQECVVRFCCTREVTA